jgi:hypothetical protein
VRAGQTTRVAALAALAVLSGACGGGDDDKAPASADSTTTTTAAAVPASTTSAGPTTTTAAAAALVRPCAEVYGEGVVFKTKADLAVCDQGGGHLFLPGSSTHECRDGRTLFWNDEGWGYLGGPFHRHAAGAEKVAPAAVREACPT